MRFRRFGFFCAFILGTAAVATSPSRAVVIINEVDYDQPGTDSTEYIELAGTAGTNLSGWKIELVNGASGGEVVYLPSPINLSNFTFTNETGTGWGFFVIGPAAVPNVDQTFVGSDQIQNGTPDGIRLIAPDASVAHYIAYEASMPNATDNVPVAVADSNAVAGSIQKTGTGATASELTWAFTTSSPGALNDGQTLTVPEPGAMSLLAVLAAVAGARRARR